MKKEAKKHTHDAIEVDTIYYKNRPAQVVEVRCADCEHLINELIPVLQEREAHIFEMLGNKPPVVIFNTKGKDLN